MREKSLHVNAEKHSPEGLYGLIGYPLGGSFSAAWFGGQGVDYRNFELPSIDELPALLTSEPSLRGINVTSPYKESVMRYIDELDPVATAVGAVNCIRIARVHTEARARAERLFCGHTNERSEECRLIGYNTDAPALRDVLSAILKNDEKALILGTGGAAKAAAWALTESGIEYRIVSRTAGDITYADITPEIIYGHRLIINATPTGSYELAGKKPPLPYHALTPEHILFDMIYNPSETPFLLAGRERGAHTCNGLGMLIRQAELSKEIWKDNG